MRLRGGQKVGQLDYSRVLFECVEQLRQVFAAATLGALLVFAPLHSNSESVSRTADSARSANPVLSVPVTGMEPGTAAGPRPLRKFASGLYVSAGTEWIGGEARD